MHGRFRDPSQANPCRTSLLPVLRNRNAEPVALEGKDLRSWCEMLSEPWGSGNPYQLQASYQETGFKTIRLQLKDHTERAGGRQYGASEDIETLQGKKYAETSRLGAVEECGSSFARRGQFARIIPSPDRRICLVVLGLSLPNCEGSPQVLQKKVLTIESVIYKSWPLSFGMDPW